MASSTAFSSIYALVNQTTGDNLSTNATANDSSLPRLPPEPAEAQRRMSVAMDNITLTEKDIPGAMLTEPFDKHTIPELRWWLLCRGVFVQTSLKKAEIIKR